MGYTLSKKAKTKAVMMFESFHKLGPVYLQDLFSVNEVHITIYETRAVS